VCQTEKMLQGVSVRLKWCYRARVSDRDGATGGECMTEMAVPVKRERLKW
jgi:hypothetical protein